MKRIILLALSLVLLIFLAFSLQKRLDTQPATNIEENTTFTTEVTTTGELSNQGENPTSPSTTETTELVTYHSNPDQETEEMPLIETTIETTTTAEMAQEKNLIAADLPETVIIDENDNKFSLYRLLDRPTIINVWASWCPPCREEMPYFQEQYDLHGEEIQFVMLNATLSRPSETKEAAQQFLKDFNFTMPMYYDLGFNNQVKLETGILPYTIVIHADGSFERYPGQISKEQLITIVDGLLAE